MVSFLLEFIFAFVARFLLVFVLVFVFVLVIEIKIGYVGKVGLGFLGSPQNHDYNQNDRRHGVRTQPPTKQSFNH